MSREDDVKRARDWLRKQGPTRLSIAPEHSAECLASLLETMRAETFEAALTLLATRLDEANSEHSFPGQSVDYANGRIHEADAALDAIRAIAKESVK